MRESKFQECKYDDYVEDGIKYLEPMTAKELKGDKLNKYIKGEVIAEEKYDGHRTLIHFTEKGVRLFSRRVSKKSDWYAENTDQVPHIRDIKFPEKYLGTVLDGEILLPIEGCTCRDVQGVTGALPETAWKRQDEVGEAFIKCFDILYYQGIKVENFPLWKRKEFLHKALEDINVPYLIEAQIYVEKGKEKVKDKIKYAKEIEDYKELYVELTSEGIEGIMLKDINGTYMQKRTDNYVKMKTEETFDVIITGYDDPTLHVDFSEIKTSAEDWQYWYLAEADSFWEGTNTGSTIEEGLSEAVTKFACKEWIGAVRFGVIKDGEVIEVGKTSGMTEEVRAYISENREKLLGTVIEVKAQCIIDYETGTLQHPRFIQFREDKTSEMCTFEDHIRV